MNSFVRLLPAQLDRKFFKLQPDQITVDHRPVKGTASERLRETAKRLYLMTPLAKNSRFHNIRNFPELAQAFVEKQIDVFSERSWRYWRRQTGRIRQKSVLSGIALD